jgi:hypothetical protein
VNAVKINKCADVNTVKINKCADVNTVKINKFNELDLEKKIFLQPNKNFPRFMTTKIGCPVNKGSVIFHSTSPSEIIGMCAGNVQE